jgi:YHS domain-containing protein
MSIFSRIHRAIMLPLLGLMMLSGAAMAGDTNLDFHGTAIQGHDPVAYFTEGRPVPGDPAITSSHDGAIYRFATTEHKAAFEADPDKYAPQYGGYCAYAAAQGAKAPIEPEQFTIADGKLYLNFNADVRERWNQDRANHISKADAFWSTQ